MSIWKYADRIVPIDPQHRLTLGEGQTPLIRSRAIGPSAGLDRLWFKLEHTNPTGSFKDRFAAAGISHMRHTGLSECITTSSGNTGASLAAYCAAAGLRCRIAIVETAPVDKLSQMLAYGAEIFRIRHFGLKPDVDRRTFHTLKKLSNGPGRSLQVSGYVFSPHGMTGVETLSCELADQNREIAHVFCPAGAGGMCVGVARGYLDLHDEGLLGHVPAVHCVQPKGNDTISSRLRNGFDRACNVECTSKISGLQVSSVVDGHLAIEACRATTGTGWTVSDDDIWNLQKRLARDEGIYSEPAGAVGLAGAIAARSSGQLDRTDEVVCIVSGSGFKDRQAVDRMNSDVECPLIDVEELEAEAESTDSRR